MSVATAIVLWLAWFLPLHAIAWRRARRHGLRMVLIGMPALSATAIGCAICGAAALHHRADALDIAALAIAAAAAVCDVETGYIFDRLLLVSAAVLVLGAAITQRADALSGIGLGSAVLFVPYALGRRRTLGFGDVKLAAVLGLALGPTLVVTALAAAAIAGGCAAAALLLGGRARRGDAMAFAPYLALGTAWAVLNP